MSLRTLTDVGRGATGIVLTGLAIVTLVAATISWGVAIAADDDLTGRTVDDRQLAAVLSAAHSCPMLSSHRLAGQLMAESGLNAAATGTESGGSGLAGLTDEDWKKWAPWPGAARTDTYASVLAMAHKMCSLSGELRQAGLSGDAWRLSLAAYRSGSAAVVAAKDVPEAAAGYVDRASGYASYYEKLPQFGRAGAPLAEDASATPEAKPLPEEYVRLVAAAGTRCPEISAATVAAQLMAGSGFDPNHLGAAGREGIAQFRSDVWERYGPRGSVWDPAIAIPAVGTALCILTAELSGVEGDPYMLALAAFNSGPDTVRRAGGIPDAVTRAHLQKVTDYTSFYGLDTRIGGKPAAAGPSASASAPASPGPSGSASPGASGSASPSAGSAASAAAAPGAPDAAPAKPVSFSYPSFGGTSGLRLNGAAKVTGGKLALTRATSQVGSAYSTTAIDPAKSFSTSFTAVISQPTDGMAFLLQSAGAGAIAAGTGESMGYSGISPSVAVEFDTWDNSGSGHGDPAGQQHIGIMSNGNVKTHLAWADPRFDMRFGQAFHVWIDYDAGAKRLSVFASQSTGKPGSPMVSHTIDLGKKFGGATVYAGFAGATGNTNLTDSSESVTKWTFTGK
ncbi:lectin-like domain-containing protein [Catenuloplanes indicus]|uniref:Legume lectin domain-containing protein n=1 Tax=Catenuloplanes indicus TaxID=137267 RepID=A0AAE3VZB6_9ACTN|nr:hypothetical protein [Catenuloplanes indicus]MDQ0366534.1 hypothetical protein [Catenuloplanes indicus]